MLVIRGSGPEKGGKTSYNNMAYGGAYRGRSLGYLTFDLYPYVPRIKEVLHKKLLCLDAVGSKQRAKDAPERALTGIPQMKTLNPVCETSPASVWLQ